MDKLELNRIYRTYIIEKMKELMKEAANGYDPKDSSFVIKEDDNLISLDLKYDKDDEEVNAFFSIYKDDRYPYVEKMHVSITSDEKYEVYKLETLLNVVNIPELYSLIVEARRIMARYAPDKTICKNSVVGLPIETIREIIDNGFDHFFGKDEAEGRLKDFHINMILHLDKYGYGHLIMAIEGKRKIDYVKLANTILNIEEVGIILRTLKCDMTTDDMVNYLTLSFTNKDIDINVRRDLQDRLQQFMFISMEGKASTYDGKDITLGFSDWLKRLKVEEDHPEEFKIHIVGREIENGVHGRYTKQC